jgi:DNA repair exonuclease SbcCD ATPase subunit
MVTIENEIHVLKTKLATIEASKQFIVQSESQLVSMQAGINQYIQADNMMKHAANITSINGIQKVKIMSALDDITHIANSFLSPLNKGIYFQFDKAKKSGEGFKPVFDVMVVNQYKEVGEMADCSGAEAGIVNFALRMALATLVANKYDFKYMIVDEGMKDMDELYLEFMATTIKNMAAQFQIFLVTHMTEFRDEFSNTLTIRKENGVSRALTS